MNIPPALPSAVALLSHVTLRTACEKLAAIAAQPPEDGSYRYEEFPFGGLPLCDHHDGPAHRCLSAPEAQARLQAVKRLTGCTLGHFLDQWDQLSAATLLNLQAIVLSVDARVRQVCAAMSSQALVVRRWMFTQTSLPVPSCAEASHSQKSAHAWDKFFLQISLLA